jgi:hypothetical protein
MVLACPLAYQFFGEVSIQFDSQMKRATRRILIQAKQVPDDYSQWSSAPDGLL